MNELLELAERAEAAMLVNLNVALDSPVGNRRTSNRMAASEWASISIALRAIASKDADDGR